MNSKKILLHAYENTNVKFVTKQEKLTVLTYLLWIPN